MSHELPKWRVEARSRRVARKVPGKWPGGARWASPTSATQQPPTPRGRGDKTPCIVQGIPDKPDARTVNGNISAVCGGITEEMLSSLREKIEKIYPSEPSTLPGEVADVFQEIGSIPRLGVEKAVTWTARAFGVSEPIPPLAGKLVSWWIQSLKPWDTAAQTFRMFDIAIYAGNLAQCKSARDLVQHAFQEEFQHKLELVVQPEKREQLTQLEPVLVSKNTLLISVSSGPLILVRRSEMHCNGHLTV